MKSFCVIGAGPAGLCAVKNCLNSGFKVIGFEKSEEVGGTWIYTEKIGVEIHSSMYEGLLTNLPKECMEYPDFPFPFEDRSFVSSEKMLKYFNLYADKFCLRDHIKFEHEVIRVRPLMDEKWEVLVKNLSANKIETFDFDFVLVCNGFSVPLVPKITGQDAFKGKQMHSHDYRKPANFLDEKVLIIGAGPSGIEIALAIGKTAKYVAWSNHTKRTFGRDLNIDLPETVEQKVDVIKFSDNSAYFEDGSFDEFSVVIYATGYDYKFPFLSIDCGLSLDNKHVQPLYKHCINIDRPSMAIIGLPYFAIGVPLYDLQVRFALRFMSNEKKLPTKELMLQETLKDEEERKSKGFSKKKSHFLGLEKHAKYYDDLASTADVEAVEPVISKIFNKTVANLFDNFKTYRFFNFKVLDHESFEENFEPFKI